MFVYRNKVNKRLKIQKIHVGKRNVQKYPIEIIDIYRCINNMIKRIVFDIEQN